MDGASKIFVFDAYGTLFDTSSAVRRHATAIGPQWSALADLWRTKQLEYTWVYGGISPPGGVHRLLPFRELTRQSLDYALSALSLDWRFAIPLLEAYATLEAFPDSAPCLSRLAAAGHRLAIFSNGDIDMLDDLVDGAGMRSELSCLISVRTAGCYKPAPTGYALVTQAFACDASHITFVSSNRWDIAGARAFGFETVWVNRAARPDEYADFPPHHVVDGLDGVGV